MLHQLTHTDDSTAFNDVTNHIPAYITSRNDNVNR